MDFTDIDAELSSEMEKDIKENTLKQQKQEEEYLLNVNNEKIKQEIIKKKQIEEDNKKKELVIKTAQEVEIKRNFDEAVNSFRIKLTSEQENEKWHLNYDCERKILLLQTELNNEKEAHNYTKKSYYRDKCIECKKPFSNHGNCYIVSQCKNNSNICYEEGNFNVIQNLPYY